MEKFFGRFVLKTIITAIIVFLLGAAFFYYSKVEWYHPGFMYILGFYTVFSWMVQYLLYKYAQKPMNVFNRAFMLLTGGKLMLLIMVMLVLAFTVPHMFKYFLSELLVVYFIFSIIEITDVLNYIKAGKTKHSG